MRSVGEPPASPEKTRARSLWSWLPVRVPAVNAGPFTTGMPMKVPDIRSGRELREQVLDGQSPLVLVAVDDAGGQQRPAGLGAAADQRRKRQRLAVRQVIDDQGGAALAAARRPSRVEVGTLAVAVISSIASGSRSQCGMPSWCMRR